MEASDKTLIDRFHSGHSEAFGRIVVRWERKVFNLAYRLSGDREEAEDIRQQAFLKAFQSLHTFNGDARFSTWLYRIVVNLSRDRLRASKVRDAALAEIHTRQADPAAALPDRAVEKSEAARLVAKAVAALPEQEREVVVLRHYHDRTFAQIAEILGTPASTLKSRMLRGMQQLHSRLKDLDL